MYSKKQYVFVLTLLVFTVFCVMTSSTAINAQPITDGYKKPEIKMEDKKSNDSTDNTKTKTTTVITPTESQIKKDDEPKDKSTPTPPELKPLLDGPIAKSNSIDKLKELTKHNEEILKGKKDKQKPETLDPTTKLPKDCTSQFDKKTNNTLIICNKTVVKTIKGPSHTNTIVKTVPADTVYKTYYYSYPQTTQQIQYSNSLSANLAQYGSNAPATYLLLLDSKQLCLIAGDTQCIAQQDRFMTSSLTTIYDSSGKEWRITGTVKDVSPDKLRDIQVTALFYDGKGNTISDALTNNVSPSKLDSFEDAVFSFKVSVKDDLNGKNPVFIVLNYSNDKNSNQNKPSSSSSDNSVGPTVGKKQSKYGVPY